MLRHYFHDREEVQNGSLSRRGSYSYLVSASALLFTALVLMLALQVIGQTTDPIWPGPTAIQFVLVHWV
ncbi:MAG: hypothetical protein ABI413_20410 [Ktedonobacteraceae bacterium]